MKQSYRIRVLLLLLLCTVTQLFAQIRGVVTDSLTQEPLMSVSVFYDGKGVGTTSDAKGEYQIKAHREWNKLTFSCIGYVTKVINIPAGNEPLQVELRASNVELDEVFIEANKEHYSTKNNSAVEFMRQVIAHKKGQKLKENDYYQYTKYQKTKLSLNDVKPQKLEKGIFKKFSFLKDQVETLPENNRKILPLSVQESASKTIFRKSPESKKTFIEGMSVNGIDDLFSTDESLATILNDIFSDVNIYDDDIRLLQRHFVNPISQDGIAFYKYYLMDTLLVDKESCVHLTFVPQTPEDFGFTGHIYVVEDSTYAVKKVIMNLPKKSGVNFVEYLNIEQMYEQLPNGKRVLIDDEMTVDLSLLKAIKGVQVKRTSKYSNYTFEPIEEQLFNLKGSVIKENDMFNKSDAYWANIRQIPLTKIEGDMYQFIDRIEQVPGFKFIVHGVKSLLQNHIETGGRKRPSKFDFGPISTLISSNYVDGTRFHLGGMTTAKLNQHWFFNGFGAYGIKDKKWKYEANATYSFRKCDNFPWEFPKHLITANYSYDVMTPIDKFLPMNKDNLFAGWTTTTVDQMSYVRNASLKYELELPSGFSLAAAARHREDTPTGNLQYIRNSSDKYPTPASEERAKEISTSELEMILRYAPGETFINTKQKRQAVSLDAPIFTLSHTAGFKGVWGGEYDFNLTEASVWKRFWLSSWGKIDLSLKAGAQWNTAPFPFLILPAANLSYFSQQETFSMLKNMEFINDRYASMNITYDMNGKLLNRLPLIKKLKWRELFRFRALYGNLTDKNNPFKNDNPDLFLFPRRDGSYTSHVMNPTIPYLEASAGIYNIFKFLHIEYVRRITYLDSPGIKKSGVRFMVQMVF